MSDWTEQICDYEENNWEDLAIKFIEKYDKQWQEFVSNKFFNEGGMFDHINEDGRNDR